MNPTVSRRAMLSLSLTALAAVTAAACSSTASSDAGSNSPTTEEGVTMVDQPQVEAELRELFTEWLAAIPAQNVEFLRSTINENWVYTDYTGHVHDRAEYLEIIANLVGAKHETELVSFDAHPITADIVICTGHYRSNGTLANGKVNAQDSRFTSVWQKFPAGWQSLVHQATNVGEAFT
ncbi:ketosteroid isomerase-like protein [Rhodococcus sp. 27YEA15]|uniref:nuclear transport factor 2 family protein n=1 Tax=Rhodococcus sp. 27YEA15 TaxID=3156259 RepID=UPI003C79C322